MGRVIESWDQSYLMGRIIEVRSHVKISNAKQQIIDIFPLFLTKFFSILEKLHFQTFFII